MTQRALLSHFGPTASALTILLLMAQRSQRWLVVVAGDAADKKVEERTTMHNLATTQLVS